MTFDSIEITLEHFKHDRELYWAGRMNVKDPEISGIAAELVARDVTARRKALVNERSQYLVHLENSLKAASKGDYSKFKEEFPDGFANVALRVWRNKETGNLEYKVSRVRGPRDKDEE